MQNERAPRYLEQLEVLQLLIKAGADLHLRNKRGMTPVQLAVDSRFHSAVLALLGE
jgi:ankyrin repeat protein